MWCLHGGFSVSVLHVIIIVILAQRWFGLWCLTPLLTIFQLYRCREGARLFSCRENTTLGFSFFSLTQWINIRIRRNPLSITNHEWRLFYICCLELVVWKQWVIFFSILYCKYWVMIKYNVILWRQCNYYRYVSTFSRQQSIIFPIKCNINFKSKIRHHEPPQTTTGWLGAFKD